MNPLEKEVWYAMYVSYRREMKVKEILDGKGIVNFIPMRYTIKVKNRRKVKELTPVIHNLIFICTTATIIRQLKEEIPLYMVKHQMRPGITGWARFNDLRGNTSIEERIRARYLLY